MDKYAVVMSDVAEKTAALQGRRCPECGTNNVNYTGSTPHCPNCGTRPWEKRTDGSQKADYRR